MLLNGIRRRRQPTAGDHRRKVVGGRHGLQQVQDDEPVQAKITAVRTANGATKLTSQQQGGPGKAVSAVRDRVNQAADDVRSGVESSVKQARETVKLAGAEKANKAARTTAPASRKPHQGRRVK